jgi:hypothetical protein
MRIHISESTRLLIEDQPYEIVERGKINVKGKGEMKTYFVVAKNQAKCPFTEIFEEQKTKKLKQALANKLSAQNSNDYNLGKENDDDEDFDPPKQSEIPRVDPTKSIRTAEKPTSSSPDKFAKPEKEPIKTLTDGKSSKILKPVPTVSSLAESQKVIKSVVQIEKRDSIDLLRTKIDITEQSPIEPKRIDHYESDKYQTLAIKNPDLEIVNTNRKALVHQSTTFSLYATETLPDLSDNDIEDTVMDDIQEFKKAMIVSKESKPDVSNNKLYATSVKLSSLKKPDTNPEIGENENEIVAIRNEFENDINKKNMPISIASKSEHVSVTDTDRMVIQKSVQINSVAEVGPPPLPLPPNESRKFSIRSFACSLL